MRKQKIIIEESHVFPLAQERFIQTCGFDLNTNKHRRMMDMGLKVREDGIEGINIQATTSFYGPETYLDGKLVIDDTEISCNYFEQIPKESVEGVYLYMLTIGECRFSSEENIMDFLYADIWGSSYVDAGIQRLTEKLKEDLQERFGSGRELYLSEEVGPGYFGMPVIDSKKFFQILDGSSIGVHVKDSGLMIPQKTCTGLYFVLNTPAKNPDPQCLLCHGNKSGCKFCSIKAKLEKENK